ncbi:MAG: cellulase family glycosylhydrolase [Acidobacteria bacterium]|nr:cellulase family glycosylhydrolase [Acidobacteriota bacterium]
MIRQKTIVTLVLILLAVATVRPALAQAAESGRSDWWNVPYPEPFDPGRLTKPLSVLRVEGNRFVDAEGRTVVLAGVNISDPDKLAKNGRWSKAHFQVIKDWGATVIRVPVHPVAWKGRGPVEYLELLDQAVVWATELGLYLIVEWHGIGNLETGLFQHPMHDTSKAETYQFWRTIAYRYGAVSTVAFYELFNEPTDYRGQLGRITWPQWKAINEEIIGIIRAHGARGIPLVGGFDWAYELRSVKDAPVDAEGIGYVSHPYPMKAQQPWEQNWERDFGHVADTYPVFATEIGFMAATDPGAHVPVMSDEEYGRRITAYFAKKGISWTAWCFDPDWPPQLISDWSYTPTTQGAFFRAVMLRKK